jgi:hypothetical protein
MWTVKLTGNGCSDDARETDVTTTGALMTNVSSCRQNGRSRKAQLTATRMNRAFLGTFTFDHAASVLPGMRSA